MLPAAKPLFGLIRRMKEPLFPLLAFVTRRPSLLHSNACTRGFNSQLILFKSRPDRLPQHLPCNMLTQSIATIQRGADRYISTLW